MPSIRPSTTARARAGQWGAQVIDELAVAPGDITVHKHRLSGFWDNELDSVLRQQGITTLMFAGINTDRCVFSTLQDANFLGYDCVLLKDACGTPSPAYVTRGIHFIVQQLHGFVATAESLLITSLFFPPLGVLSHAFLSSPGRSCAPSPPPPAASHWRPPCQPPHRCPSSWCSTGSTKARRPGSSWRRTRATSRPRAWT
jgi:hypothetical protein